MALPQNGQTGWGTILNSQITSDEANIAANTTAIAAHEANEPTDPHGDRAYTQTVVAPITSGTNGPNGYVVCNSEGYIPQQVQPLELPAVNYHNVQDTVTESIFLQFEIPVGDWTQLQSYNFKAGGLLSWINSPTIIFQWRIGLLGTASDPLFTEQVFFSLPTFDTNQSFFIEGSTMIDSLNNWWNFDFNVQVPSCNFNPVAGGSGSSFSFPPGTGPVWCSLSCTWSSARTANILSPKMGFMQRVIT